MPEIRRHIITGDPILFAPGRADRPNAFGGDAVDRCPFCPGNESMTPAEIERTGDPWRVRVFPNKYPSVAEHEVIVESAAHDAAFDSISHADEIIETYIRRYRAHASAAYVSLFRNDGRIAGASIDHAHAQLMALPFVPPRIERETAAFTAASSCPLCAAIESHRSEGLLISEHGSFVRLAPKGSTFAWEQWIVPRRHQPDIAGLSDEERDGLAAALRAAIRSVRGISAAHNTLFMNFREPAAHLYIAVIPRRTALAGFELGTGTFIDIIDPAAAARALR